MLTELEANNSSREQWQSASSPQLAGAAAIRNLHSAYKVADPRLFGETWQHELPYS